MNFTTKVEFVFTWEWMLTLPVQILNSDHSRVQDGQFTNLRFVYDGNASWVVEWGSTLCQCRQLIALT